MWLKRINHVSLHLLYSTINKHKYCFEAGVHMIPHPAKTFKGGEDSYVLSDNVLAVFDGVGGWADQGIDPGLYTKRLATIVQTLIKNQNLKYVNDPIQLLVDAVAFNKEIGSTTACILTLHPQDGTLNFYYVGDSVYGILEKEKALIAQQQQKSFNFPFQVGSSGDSPRSGIYYSEPYDQQMQNKVFVLATDGLWDNLNVQYIHQLGYQSEQSLSQRVKKLVEFASKASLAQGNYESPFHLKAKQAKLNYPKEGKPDDITVILAKIIKKQIKN